MNCIAEDPAYSGLKDRLIASTGLAFYADRDKLLSEVIGGRLSGLGLRDCTSYTQLLGNNETGSAEMDVLIEQLTIGETSFFRDEAVFAAIREVIFADILERKQASRQLRIWSAGCATGAEPYSLAIMLMDEFADRIAGWQVAIHATDLNRSFLAKAAKGTFREWALHTTSDQVKRQCFSAERLGWTIHPRYKQWILFHHVNLAESEFSAPWIAAAPFDLILCRNVMIYFAPDVNRRLIGQFHRSLDDGGWLVVGSSEHNLENYQAFRTVNAPGARVYQKRALPCRVSEVAPKPPLPCPMVAALQPSAKPPANMADLRQLLDRGDWQAASEYSQELLTEYRLNPEIHFYQALIFENLGIADRAEQSLRRAIYLNRNFALAHYHLGLFLKRNGRIHASSRSFGNVLKILADTPDEAILTAGVEVTATGLRELAKMHMGNSSGA